MASFFKRMLPVRRSQSPVQVPEEIRAASDAAHLLLPSPNNVKEEEQPFEEFEKIVHRYPEFKHLMEQLIHMLDLRSYRLKLVVAKLFVKLWQQRSVDPNTGIQRSQEQLLEILKQPCTQVELQIFMKGLPEQLDRAEELQIFMKGLPEQLDKEEETTAESNNGSPPTFTKHEAMNIIFQPIVEIAISGIDIVYSNEIISNEKGIPQSVKTVRALEKYAAPPCGLKMRKQEYNELSDEDKATANSISQKYAGGRRHMRKTKKSRCKKTRKLRRR
jgi:hypothetical protein